jgi:precorrin-3B C17-methyltransferase
VSEASGGSLAVVGLGPGDPRWLVPEARQVLEQATDLIGYQTYLDLIPADLLGTQRLHGSDNRVELDRARHALDLAASGHRVAVVSSGDPGVFAMAAAVFEAVDAPDAPAEWSSVHVHVVPGITAALATAAEAGAPLGHDFCLVSLSDNLKPWSIIERRLLAAADGDFVIALYNPASKARPHQLGQAFDLLRTLKSADTPVLFVRAAGTADAQVITTTLVAADPSRADMRTLVIVGASTTRQVGRWVYTPRSERAGRS